MNRTVLFRGKRVDNGEWVEGCYCEGATRHCISVGLPACQHFDIEPETVGEWTGLTDKNVQKIFEDDILKVTTRNSATICKVVFQDGCFVGMEEDGGECDFRYLIGVEVIGNVYDNPDLWKLEVDE